MDNIKLIAKVEMVCDCIPVVSTLTNAALLLLKLAIKVNLVANPVSPGWKDDIKMHAVYKSAAECFWNMIPYFSNIANLIRLLAWGFDYKIDPIESAIFRKDIDVVKVHLTRYPNEPENQMQRYLRQSVYSSPEIVSLLLKSREWSQASLVNSLRGIPGMAHVEEANNLILDYLDRFPKITIDNHYSFKSRFIEFARIGRFNTAERFLKHIPRLTLEDVEDLFIMHTFQSTRLSEYNDYILTEEQLDIIINKLERFDFKSFDKYLCLLGRELENFRENILINNQYFNANLNLLEMVDVFFNGHFKCVYKLISKLAPPINKEEICDLIVRVINEGLTPLVSLIMDKFESELSKEDKIAIINRCERRTYHDTYLVSQAFACFFTVYCSDFTSEERDEINQLLSGRRFRKLNFAAIKSVKLS